MAFGIAFSIKANLGTSPISSVPYVVSSFTSLSVGEATIIMHCVFHPISDLATQKKFCTDSADAASLVAFIFGYLTDFALYILKESLTILICINGSIVSSGLFWSLSALAVK